MGKLVTILGACVVAAGGAGYAYYSYSEQSGCTLARRSCCELPPLTDAASEATGESPAMAVAGPAALFTTSAVKAEAKSCCLTKTKVAFVHACCMDEGDAPTANGLVAVTGTAASVAKR